MAYKIYFGGHFIGVILNGRLWKWDEATNNFT